MTINFDRMLEDFAFVCLGICFMGVAKKPRSVGFLGTLEPGLLPARRGKDSLNTD